MHYSFVTLIALAAAATAQTSSNAGCSPDFSGQFLIVPLNVTLSQHSKRQAAAQEAPPSCEKPTITLKNGILHDQSNSQGEIVANNQLQFDPILQPGRKFDSGFCVYGNGSLAVGGSAIFYSCISGGFSNLYNADIGSVCSQVYLNATACVIRPGSGISSVSGTTSGTSTPATVPSTPASSAAPPPVTTPTPASAPAPAAPYPKGNTTTTAASGSAVGTKSTTTTAGTSSTSPATFQPSSGANAIAIGSQIMAGIAAIGAFAMF